MGVSISIYFIIWTIFLFIILSRKNIPTSIKWVHLIIFIALGTYWFPDIIQGIRQRIFDNTEKIFNDIVELVQISFLSLVIVFSMLGFIISKIQDEDVIKSITYFMLAFFIIIVLLYVFVEMRGIIEIQIKK